MPYLFAVIVWTGAVIATLIPGLLALDSGGVLPWSYWSAAGLLLLPALAGFAGLRGEEAPRGVQSLLLVLVCLLVALYAVLQSVPLPAGVSGWLSPGAASAWNDWLASVPLGEAGAAARLGDASALPLSVAPDFTLPRACYFLLLAAAAWCGATLFSDRDRLLLLLAGLAFLGAVHAGLGLWQLGSRPDETLWGIPAGHPFGTFVNRNNASLMLNLGFAAALGLLGWRLSILTGLEFRSEDFRPTAILDVLGDRMAQFALAAAILCIAGLIGCGSRGGLAGLLLGLALGVGMFSSRRILVSLFAVITLVALLAMVLLVRVNVSPESLSRFDVGEPTDSSSLLDDRRIPHWQDALAAAGGYFPGGSGLGTYRYAYAPYEDPGSNGWFQNADNLWLEWLVEGGLPAALGMLAVLGILVYALLQLRETPDPMDHGIATAGWAALGATLASQLFDFGLLLAGSGIGILLLFGALVGRASAVGVPLWHGRGRQAGEKFKLRSPRTHLRAAWFAGALAIVGLLLSLRTFHREALVDAAVRQATAGLVSRPSDYAYEFEKIDRGLETLRQVSDRSGPHYRLELTRGQLQLERASLLVQEKTKAIAEDEEVTLGAGDGTLADWRRLLAEVRRAGTQKLPPFRREQLDALATEAGDVLDLADEPLELAAAAAQRALGRCPLSAEARFLLLEATLDDQSTEDYEVLTTQLMKLRRQSIAPLENLALLSGLVDDWQRSSQAWTRIVRQRPQFTGEILRRVEATGNPDYGQVVPPVERALVEALEYELAKPQGNPVLIKRLIEMLAEHQPTSRYAQAERLDLLGKGYVSIGQLDQAIDQYRQAAQLVGKQERYHVKLVRLLRQAGKPRQALAAARSALEEVRGQRAELVAIRDRLEKKLSEAQATSEPFADRPRTKRAGSPRSDGEADADSSEDDPLKALGLDIE